MKDVHHGEIIELAIRSSPYSLVEVARLMGLSRSTLYNRFKEPKLSLEFMLDLGKLIEYDFSYYLPNPQKNYNGDFYVEEQPTTYLNNDKETIIVLQKKYFRLLEHYNRLMELCIRFSRGETSANIDRFYQEIIRFFDEKKVEN